MSGDRHSVPRVLIDEVDLLCLDAGNTVIFFDHARLARLVADLGHPVATEALVVAEGAAKIAQQDDTLVRTEWDEMHKPGAHAWASVVGTMLVRAGVDGRALPAVIPALWREHLRLNLYSLVPDGLGAALDHAREAGVKVAIVSNSEGTLAALFEQLGIARHFDAIVDSGVVGVSKPDPRIFDFALEAARVPPERALMLGDTYATDIVGAERAGVRAALIDPHRHLDGRHPEVPRVPGVVAVARAIAFERASRIC